MTLETDRDVDLVPEAPAAPARRRRGGLAAGLAALLVVAAGVAVAAGRGGSDGDGVVAVGPDFFANAAATTEAAESFRFEALLSLQGAGLDLTNAPIFSGEQVGAASRVVFDMSAVGANMGVPDVGGEMFEAISDGQVLFLRAPLFADLAGRGALPPEVAPLASLGTGWGRIDLTAVDASVPTQLSALVGAQALDLDSVLDLLRAAGEPEVLGAGEVRGVSVERYAATVTMGEMIDSSGTDVAALDEIMAGAGAEAAGVLDAIRGVELRLEVAVDEAGVVRRFVVSFDEAFFEAIAAEIDAPVGDISGISFGMAFEVFDVGDPTIAIVLPDAPDAVDLTPWALQLAQQPVSATPLN